MTLFVAAERRFAESVVELSYCNPFSTERIELERRALGTDFDETAIVWSRQDDWDQDRANVVRLNERCEQLTTAVRERILAGQAANLRDVELYEDLANYVLFYRYRRALSDAIDAALLHGEKPGVVKFWKAFLADYRHLLEIPGRKRFDVHEAAHLFAGFFQIRRAFYHIFENIVGRSVPAARLRAAVWQSVFTYDMRRYRRTLYRRMGDFATLIMGPSGTGKELVARAVGLSRYIPFDPEKQQFTDDFAGSFHPLNLSALSATLLESELFGYRRGAFTGATADRAGWLEVCRPLGTVFLDEIGDLDIAIQVKLLRVLQSRTFQRSGDTETRHFQGKIIAATNQDLTAKMQQGEFREDFYYRLCSDIITTPSLCEQLADCPGDLRGLVVFIAHRIVGEEAESLAEEVKRWILANLGSDYAWPGNIRELEQCVRNVLVRQQYVPAAPATERRWDNPLERIAAEITAGSLTADELLRRYCTVVYAQTGSYEQAAQKLRLDRRTVKSKVDAELLAQFRR